MHNNFWSISNSNLRPKIDSQVHEVERGVLRRYTTSCLTYNGVKKIWVALNSLCVVHRQIVRAYIISALPW